MDLLIEKYEYFELPALLKAEKNVCLYRNAAEKAKGRPDWKPVFTTTALNEQIMPRYLPIISVRAA